MPVPLDVGCRTQGQQGGAELFRWPETCQEAAAKGQQRLRHRVEVVAANALLVCFEIVAAGFRSDCSLLKDRQIQVALGEGGATGSVALTKGEHGGEIRYVVSGFDDINLK